MFSAISPDDDDIQQEFCQSSKSKQCVLANYKTVSNPTFQICTVRSALAPPTPHFASHYVTARVSFPTTRSRAEFAAAGPAIVHLPPNYPEVSSKSVLDSYYNGDKGRRHQRTLVRRSCMVADQFRNTGGGPEIGSVAVHHGLLQQKVDQAPSLLPIQLQRSTWRGAHPQPLGSTSPSGRQRITELALQPIRRHTSLRE